MAVIVPIDGDNTGIVGIVVIIKQYTRIGIPAKKAKNKIRIIKVMQNFPDAMATGKS